MHICFLTNEYPKEGFPHGGIGSFVKSIAHSLVNLGVRVSVVGINYSKHNEIENDNGVTVYRLKRNRVKGLTWYFNEKAINKTISTIHAKTPISIVESTELGLAFIQKIKDIKYVIRLHGGHHFFAEAEKRGINKWKGFQEKRSFKKADAFIAVSEYVKQHTANYLSYNNKPITVIFNPINTQLFQPVLVSDEPNSIVFVGTVCEKKGVRQLIQALPYIKEKFPNAILNIYGRDWFFPDGSSYIKMLQEKVLSKMSEFVGDVVFHGSVAYDKIPLVYAKSAVCVFPSHMETLGLVAPEAMAMEKAVVFTNAGPGPEIIDDKVTGLLCNPYDPQDIANKIIWLLENTEKASNIAKNARKAVLNQFEITILVKKNIEFYKTLY